MAPRTAKGQVRKYETCCVAWLDLLGYGTQLREVDYDPTEPKAVSALERLHAFHVVIGQHSCRLLPSLVLNDGAIFFRDLSPRSRSVTWDFLKRCIALFEAVRDREFERELPGARMVIGAGFRVRREGVSRSANDELGNVILKKLERSEISAVQAVKEALYSRPHFDILPEIQANFALTKAYLADLSGKDGGLPGANCYIDLSMFRDPVPPWITFSRTIAWSYRGMAAEFGQLSSYDHKLAAKVRGEGTLDGWQVAKCLSRSEDVLSRLRKARLTDNIRG